MESPLRDVAYFLHLSVAPSFLGTIEEDAVKFYLEKLSSALSCRGLPCPLAFDEAWRMYRLQALYSLLAFVVTSGAGSFVKDKALIYEMSSRTVGACDRLHTAELLDSLVTAAGRR